jgi:hypothetical protein
MKHLKLTLEDHKQTIQRLEDKLTTDRENSDYL